jgi:RNase P protein component
MKHELEAMVERLLEAVDYIVSVRDDVESCDFSELQKTADAVEFDLHRWRISNTQRATR